MQGISPTADSGELSSRELQRAAGEDRGSQGPPVAGRGNGAVTRIGTYGQKWLVSVGDQVVTRMYEDYEFRYWLGKVVAVTPTGQVRLGDGRRYLPNGNRIGEPSEHILPATEDNLALYREQVLREHIRSKAEALLRGIGGLKLTQLEETWEYICRATGEADAVIRDLWGRPV